ncbi:hypothetical protein AJ88_46760 [Mesorhizobium amorphae CCBAU 01583]|nr:hypothetical protein AJ88_46760 [Mesorhizobium amorphae CCBAU 01583]
MKREMTVVIAGLETKSEKIRALLHEGYMRTEVADFLNIRYQHVRKVAVDAGIEGGLQRGLVVVPKSKPIPKVRADVAIDVSRTPVSSVWVRGWPTAQAASGSTPPHRVTPASTCSWSTVSSSTSA